MNTALIPASKFRVELEVDVEITIHDATVVSRCVENVDGWREHFYSDLDNEKSVLEHLAFNWIVNHTPAWRLDGWADLEPGCVEYGPVDVQQAEA